MLSDFSFFFYELHIRIGLLWGRELCFEAVKYKNMHDEISAENKL